MIARHADTIHLMPPDHGLWVPAGAGHGRRLSSGSPAESIGLHLSRLPAHLSEAATVTLPASTLPLVRRLAQEEFPAESLPFIETVILDLLIPAHTALTLPLPSDPTLREFCERVLEDPVGPHPATHYASLAGITAATLSAHLQRQTGLSWPQWLFRVRMYTAVLLLGHGLPVGEVAHRVQYSAPSRFSTAFRRLFGVTPKEFKSRAPSSNPLPLGELTLSALAATTGRDSRARAASAVRPAPRRTTSA